MRDPVNNFEIPPEWLQRSSLPRRVLEEGICSGRLVLLSTGDILHRGYTTGTTAAAAVKAAVLSLKQPGISEVMVKTPIRLPVRIPVHISRPGTATAVKYAGDHCEDVTGGIEITAHARESKGLQFSAGRGIGIAGRDIFHLKKGEPAINPAPRKQIIHALKEAIRETKLSGAEVLLTVPRGEEIAERTLNPELGIVRGISILGTTGFVEPWSEHLQSTKEALIEQSDNRHIVLTTGRKGMHYAHMLFPEHTVILVGNRIQKTVETAKRHNKNTILCGLPALILKWANPDILHLTGHVTVQDLMEQDPRHPLIIRSITDAADRHGIRIILFDKEGRITHDTAGESGEE